MIGYEAAVSAFLLAYCFFAIGELLLNRRSRDIFAINRSFLTGLSVTAVSIFPLSVAFPGSALVIVLVGLLAAGGAVFYRTIKTWAPPNMRSFWTAPDPLSSVFFVLIALLFVQFWRENFRLSYLWDGYQIWATKALVLYHDGGLGKTLISPVDGSLQRILDYPPMLPLYEALVAKLRGSFEWNALKPVFDFFYISLLVSTYDAARSLASRRIAMGATALLALVPEVSTRYAIGGYADMPEAAMVAGALAALLRAAPGRVGFRSAAPWILAGVLFLKSEGVILAIAACAGVAAYTLLRPPRDAWARVRQQWVAYVVFAGCFLVRRLMTVWLHTNDLTYGPFDHAHLQRAVSNLALVPKLCLKYATELSEWGVFWPAFVIAAVIVLLAGSQRERLLTLATFSALAAYTSIFYFTNWSIPLHIDQAYDRLLTHLSPVAAVIMAVAFQRLWGIIPKTEEFPAIARYNLMADLPELRHD